jgi:protein-disulfide isomerase
MDDSNYSGIMSEENNTPEAANMQPTTSNETNITIKKSTYNRLLVAAIIPALVATFFAGFFLAGTTQDTNPDFVTKSDLDAMITKLESKMDSLKQPAPVLQPSQPSAPSIFMVSLDDDPFKGNPDAPITIVEFSDFQCPFCSRFVQQTLSQLEQSYIDTGKVKFVYRDLPLDSLHPNARPTHIAAECADEQGKFWQYHDVLFENQTQWNKMTSEDLDDTLVQYAQDLSLDVSSFEACLNSPEIADEVNKDYLEATRYGVSGTPTFFIGNEKDGFTKLVGAQPFAAFESQIESQLES